MKHSILGVAGGRYAAIEWDGPQGRILFIGSQQEAADYLHENFGSPEIVPGDYDCQACGACCRSYFGRVNLTDDDCKRTPVLLHAVADQFGRHIPRYNGACPALWNKRDERGPGVRYVCNIYDDRPDACRRLEPGSPGCLAARKVCGL